jgi:small subunit ribosomal protein S9
MADDDTKKTEDQAPEAPAETPAEEPKAEKPEKAPKAEKPKKAPKAEKAEEAPKAEKPKKASKAEKAEEAPKAEKPKKAPKAEKAEEAPKAEKPKKAPKAKKSDKDDAPAEESADDKPAEAAAEKPAEKPVEKVEERSRPAPPVPEGKHYFWGTGRRKKAIARVRIRPGKGDILVNKREMMEYFVSEKDRNAVLAPLKASEMSRSWDIFVNVGGGGSTGQAGAIKLGLARAIAKAVPDAESTLRNQGLLTRDPRMVERKKPGQPGARKRFQFSKR